MKQIARVSLVDTVVGRLREEIASGSWPVGSKIPTEARLIEELGVSRTSVREGVRSLVQLGLLETRQGDGTYVIADDETTVALQGVIDAADEAEVLAVRRALDVLAAREAAARRGAGDVTALRSALDARRAAVAADDVAAFIDSDVAFHLGIARASQNSLLFRLYQTFEDSLRESVGRANCSAISDDARGDFHEDLFGAIAEHRGDDATRAAIQVLDDHARVRDGGAVDDGSLDAGSLDRGEA
jgi:DNA-binding FadR family transcriptional regulator